MADLPPELIYEVLIRLPTVKDIIRSTSVSKLWNTIVCSKDFIKEHDQRAVNSKHDCAIVYLDCHNHFNSLACSPSSFTIGATKQPMKHPLYSLEERKRLGILSSIAAVFHGLILLKVVNWSKGETSLFLWNPMLAKHRVISRTKPIDPIRIYGLGYHCGEDDLKVLAFEQPPVNHGTSMLEIYSLASNTWKRIKKPPPSNLQLTSDDKQRMVSLNNSCVAWMMVDMDDSWKSYVLTFDIVKEEYHAFPTPDRQVRYWNWKMMKFGGFLSCYNASGDRTHIWIMKDSSWSLISIGMVCVPLFFDGERFLLSEYSQLEYFGNPRYRNFIWYSTKTQEYETIVDAFDLNFEGAGTGLNFDHPHTFCEGNLRLLLDGYPDGRHASLPKRI